MMSRIECLLALQRIAPQLARSIGAGSPALVDCMQALPGGAEPLLLSMLMVLTGKWLCCSYDTLLPGAPQKPSLDSLVMSDPQPDPIWRPALQRKL